MSQQRTKSNLKPQRGNFQFPYNSKKHTRPETRLLEEQEAGSCNQKQTGLAAGAGKQGKKDTGAQSKACRNQRVLPTSVNFGLNTPRRSLPK